jgi:hypothetical protein
MNKVGQILLIVGAIVLAFLIGVLVGRRTAQPDIAQPPAGVQITTEAPAAPPTVTTPLEAPVQAPPQAPAPRVAPDQQVQEDAAAVGMTTRDEPADGSEHSDQRDAPAAAQPNTPPAQSTPPTTPTGDQPPG